MPFREHLNEHLDYGYWIGRYPVTNAQFRAFVKAGGYRERAHWSEAEGIGLWEQGQIQGRFDDEPRDRPYDFGDPFSLPNHPVVGVTWYEALAYGRWLAERLREDGLLAEGWTVRLPSEAEWEKAARGGLEVPDQPLIALVGARGDAPLRTNPNPRATYPWGDKADPNRANYDETGIGTTSAVGCFPAGASPYGVEDLSGNLWEWTRSLWGRDFSEPEFKYPYNPADDRENQEAGVEILRVLRGGSFDNSLGVVRCACRLWVSPSYGFGFYGFRVVVVPVDR